MLPLPATLELSGHIRANGSRKQEEEWGEGGGRGDIPGSSLALLTGTDSRFILNKNRLGKAVFTEMLGEMW